MLILKFKDGTTRQVNSNIANFNEIGVTVTNEVLRTPECVTYDLLEGVEYHLTVTEAMRKRSQELQFEKTKLKPGQSKVDTRS